METTGRIILRNKLAKAIYAVEEALEAQQQGDRASYLIDHGEFSGPEGCNGRADQLGFMLEGLYERMERRTGLDYRPGFDTAAEELEDAYEMSWVDDDHEAEYRHAHRRDLIFAEALGRYGAVDDVLAVAEGRPMSATL